MIQAILLAIVAGAIFAIAYYVKSNNNKNIVQSSEQFVDDNFELLKETFNIVVPMNYNFTTQIDQFVEKIRKQKKIFIAEEINSKNFANATDSLIPGREYIVKFFAVKGGKEVSLEKCLELYENQKAILTGTHGSTLVYDLHSKKIPKNKIIISLDENEKSGKNSDGDNCVMGLWNDKNTGDLRIGMHNINMMFREFRCLLCFYEIHTEVR